MGHIRAAGDVLRWLAPLVVVLWWNEVAADVRVYEAEGQFTMGDTDTKEEAQIQAKLRAKTAALDEAGTYIEHIVSASWSERADGLEESYRQDITTIAAGMVFIRDEDVQYTSIFHAETGTATWVCKVKAKIEEEDVVARVRKIQDNRQLLAGLEEARAENERRERELERLRSENKSLRTELTRSRGRGDTVAVEQRSQRLATVERERQVAVKRLKAVEHFRGGLYAHAGGDERAARQEYEQAVAMGYEAPRAYLTSLQSLGFAPTFRERGYEEIAGGGYTYTGGKRYFYGTFLQGGYLFFRPIGVESSVIETIQKDGGDSGLFFILPLGLFFGLVQTDYALLNISARAYLFNRVSHFEKYQGDDKDWRSFPPFVDAAIEWRGPLHGLRAGYRYQTEADHGGEDWPAEVDLSGFYVSAHVGLTFVVPAKSGGGRAK